MTGSDFANWWDQTVVKNQGPVVTWIKDNPGLASIVFTPLIPMAFTGADALVDVARIGEGLGEAASDEATALDVAKGLGTDVARALSVIPFFRAPGMVVKFGLQRVAVRASLFTAARGGLCTEKPAGGFAGGDFSWNLTTVRPEEARVTVTCSRLLLVWASATLASAIAQTAARPAAHPRRAALRTRESRIP